MPLVFECPICLDDEASDNDLSATSCGHLFHTRCIRDWIGQAGGFECPSCSQIMGRLKSQFTKLYVQSIPKVSPDAEYKLNKLKAEKRSFKDKCKKMRKEKLVLKKNEEKLKAEIQSVTDMLENVGKENLVRKKNEEKLKAEIQSVTDMFENMGKENLALKKNEKKLKAEIQSLKNLLEKAKKEKKQAVKNYAGKCKSVVETTDC